jgi:RecA-family ATPase
VIAAPPKAGKSWFALGISAAIAAGGVALGSISVEQGEAVYYALEDPARRLKDRLGRVLQGGAVPGGVVLRDDASPPR